MYGAKCNRHSKNRVSGRDKARLPSEWEEIHAWILAVHLSHTFPKRSDRSKARLREAASA
jgi:hypothetical protein